MRALTYTLIGGIVLAGSGSTAVAGDILVICHPPVSMTADEVRDVYFGEKAFAGAVKLAPADNSAVQAAFLEKVMKLDAKKYTALWIKKAFRDGSAAPSMKASDAEAISYVKQTPGACSYIATAAGDGVIVVAKF